MPNTDAVTSSRRSQERWCSLSRSLARVLLTVGLGGIVLLGGQRLAYAQSCDCGWCPGVICGNPNGCCSRNWSGCNNCQRTCETGYGCGCDDESNNQCDYGQTQACGGSCNNNGNCDSGAPNCETLGNCCPDCVAKCGTDPGGNSCFCNGRCGGGATKGP